MIRTTLLALTVAALLNPFSSAGAPPAPAATAPATTKPQQKIVVPPGFEVVAANGRSAIVEPADKQWVTDVLNKLPAQTKPATLPTTLLQRVSTNREPIIRQMMSDLAIADPVPLANAYDTQLTPQMRTLDNLKPPFFYIVTSIDRMGEVMKGGWEYPHFYYNRAADAVSFNPTGLLNTEGAPDDVIYPVMYEKTDTPEKRTTTVSNGISEVEKMIAKAIEQQAINVVPTIFVNIVNSVALEPLALKPDQTWFGVGVANVLSAKYAAPIYDMKREQLVQSITLDNPGNPLRAGMIDLLKPADLQTMRQEAIPAYFDTVRRKSSVAIQNLIDRGGGDAALGKAFAAIRAKKPADGPALVKVIQEATGVDLTPFLVRS